MSEHVCISVIVPYYNAQSHIQKCIDLLLNQDFKNTFEIIMVDDGSTDNSKKIVLRNEDNKIHSYSLEKNSGPSAARNYGIKKSKGEYIFFLDVDDTVDLNILSVMYNKAIENSYDLIFCERRYIENFKNTKEDVYAYPADKHFEKSEINNEMKNRFYDPLLLFGLFDLTGNASEWVHNFYTLIPPDNKKVYFDPLGPEFGEGHVVKGASWRSGTRTQLRASFRDGLNNKRNDVGFRIGRYLYAKEAASKN